MDMNATIPPPADTAVPRFTTELEFVSALANPMYLQYLGTNFHHLLNPPETTDGKEPDENCDANKFARYLKYLLYWKTPEYSRFLTHPAATIRNLELLQNQSFRSSVQHPDLAARLAEGFSGAQIYEAPKPTGQQDDTTDNQPDVSDAAATNGTGTTTAVAVTATAAPTRPGPG